MRFFFLPFRFAVFAFLLLALGIVPPARADVPEVYAITNARIIPAAGKTIARGTVVLRDGLIVAVGDSATVVLPADATIIDGKGLTVYPGMIDGYTHLGMPDASDYTTAARGDTYPVPSVRAENSATGLMKPDSAGFESRRKIGFGAALTAPYIGIVSGTSALVVLGTGSDNAALTLKSPVAMHIDFGANDAASGYPNSLMGEIALTRQVLYDTQDAARRAADYEKNPSGKARPVASRALLALRPAVEHQLPVIFHADSAQMIRRALKIAREFDLRPVIEGGTESYAVADLLKKANAVVLLSTMLPEPPKVSPGDEDPSTLQGLRLRALAPRSAAALARAGVPFMLTTSGLTNVSDFNKNVRVMIAAGLAPDTALDAVTGASARFFGLEKQLGTIEVGKIGNLLVTDGDLFGEKTHIKQVFVDGRKVDLGKADKPAAGGAAAVDLAKILPPGVSPDDARQFITANPDEAKKRLPPGVTMKQARIALGMDAPAKDKGTKPTAAPSKVVAPPVVGSGLVPPLPPALPSAFVLRGGTVWTVGAQGILKNTDVYVSAGKIVQIGTNLTVPAGTTEIDAHGKMITPGMIDCHSHTAIEGGVNEGTNIITGECRIADVLDAEDVNIYRQLGGGTTMANVLHGSANAIGGQNAVVKWRWGAAPDELIFQPAPQGIKFALGENPKRSNGFAASTRYPATRLGVEKVIREAFVRARDYQKKWQEYKAGKTMLAPRRDLQLDALVEVLEGKRLVHCHSYRQDEILMMMRVAEEFGFRVATFQHVLEGYKIADEMAKHGAGGSTFSDWWAFKIEAWDAIPYNGALMAERGVIASFNSDDAELARRLNLEAAKAMHWGGLSPEEAIKFVTINPAKQLGVDKYVGSLEAGKDADIVVWSGNPLSSLSICEKTFVDGKLLFDRAADLAARAGLEAEKKRLALAEKPDTAPKPEVVPKPASGTAKTSQPTATTPPPASSTPALVKTNVLPTFTKTVTLRGKYTGADKTVTALVGGRIHPVTGAVIENGVLLMQGDRILALGTAANVTVPGDAKKVDVSGLQVYPGLIDADTTLGLSEIESIRATQDSREMGDFNPELRVAPSVNPDSELIRVARASGILTAATAPSGGTVSGIGALINLDGWTWEDMTINRALGLYMTFPSTGARRFRETGHRCEEGAGSSEMDTNDDPAFRSGAFVPGGSLDRDALLYGFAPQAPSPSPQTPLRRPRRGGTPPPGASAAPNNDTTDDDTLNPLNTFEETARRYRDARQGESKGAPLHEIDHRFEAMLPVLGGNVPLFVRADREKDIRAALKWAKTEGLHVVIVGGQEADKCADLLVKENVPVILGPVQSLPPRFDSPYDAAYTLPTRLAKVGVRYCLSTGAATNVRWLAHNAGMAAAYGLAPDEALKAITLYPAQILGMGDRLGSLEVGKDANLILTNGDPLERSTDIRAAYIAGHPVDLGNKQLRLYERYRSRPLPAVGK